MFPGSCWCWWVVDSLFLSLSLSRSLSHFVSVYVSISLLSFLLCAVHGRISSSSSVGCATESKKRTACVFVLRWPFFFVCVIEERMLSALSCCCYWLCCFFCLFLRKKNVVVLQSVTAPIFCFSSEMAPILDFRTAKWHLFYVSVQRNGTY